ncbi:hypothetical protein D3C75_952990 [compost metagenome]
MSYFVVFDVLDHLRGLNQLLTASQLVEEVEALIEVDAFEHEVSDENALQVLT